MRVNCKKHADSQAHPTNCTTQGQTNQPCNEAMNPCPTKLCAPYQHLIVAITSHEMRVGNMETRPGRSLKKLKKKENSRPQFLKPQKCSATFGAKCRGKSISGKFVSRVLREHPMDQSLKKNWLCAFSHLTPRIPSVPCQSRMGSGRSFRKKVY